MVGEYPPTIFYVQAPQLYNTAFERLQKTKQELSHAIHQAKLCAALKKHELEINRLTQLANKYHIPILTESPKRQPHSFCKIYEDARAEKYIQNAIEEGKYNIALAPTINGTLYLIYDEYPIQRSCNRSNIAQTQHDVTNGEKNTFTQNDQYSRDMFDIEER